MISAPNAMDTRGATNAAWLSDALDRLENLPCGYVCGSLPAAEPTSLAALVLALAGRREAARRGLEWLSNLQQPDGRVVPQAGLKWPGWPTSMALIAAAALPERGPATEGHSPCEFVAKALEWLLLAAGTPLPQSTNFGHDVRLVGWSWADATHSWVEPTAWSVLALKAWGQSTHPRTREGVQLLVDRLLDVGGCNYGNTTVLGQRLRPHVEPSGLAMLALADENLVDPRIERSLRYLQSVVSAETTPISLSYGIVGLSAFDRRPADTDEWLAAKYREVIACGAAPHAVALLALADLNTWPTNMNPFNQAES